MDDPTGIEMNIPKKAQSVQKRPSKIEIIAAALGLYVLMSILDPWIAMPMRAGSSWTAFAFLRVMGLPFELQGVVLTAPSLVDPPPCASWSFLERSGCGRVPDGQYPGNALESFLPSRPL